MSKNHFPGANITAQYWAGKFIGSTMNTNSACIHTTETGNAWPGYSGGAVAPHMTIRPIISEKRVDIRQHFPAGKSSRALVNLAGGVETNTLNIFQIELIGTCDSRYRYSRKEWGIAGVDYIYWPDAPDWLLAAIAPVFKWLDAEWENFKIADAAPRGWVRYPDSYGLNARQRMTFKEFLGAYGIFGHQHVPENTHGDPGDFPMKRLLAIISGIPVPEEPEEPPVVTPPKQPQVAVWDLPSTWEIGSTGAAVTKLGERLVLWAKYLGLPAPYSVGPGPEFTETDRAAVAAFQRAQGWSGADADGYPGPETFKRLAATPPARSPKSRLHGLHWNVAGSDDTNGYGAKNGTRGPAVGAYALGTGFDVFTACEAGQDNLRRGISRGLGSVVGKTEWMQRAKAIWYNPVKVKNKHSRKAYSDNIFAYLNTLKWGAAFFGEKDGVAFSVLEIHTDYRAPAKQAKQVQTIFKKWRADCDKYGIKHTNQYVVGDFNWDGTSGDDPFKALAAWNFEEKGSRTTSTFMGRKHLDGVLAHVDADVDVTVLSRADLSDHNPVEFNAVLNK